MSLGRLDAQAQRCRRKGTIDRTKPSRRRAIPAPLETNMNRFEARSTMFAGAAVALAMMASTTVLADTPAGSRDEAPVVVAQLGASQARTPAAVPMTDAFPAYQRGVRQAAAEGNEALRRYVWRTRMIYNFYYHDFAPKD
jgi:hypothetical protein